MTKSIVRVFLVSTLLLPCTGAVAFAQLTKVKSSYSALTANMAAYWLAKETGLFEKHGLDVDVVLIESGVTTVQALDRWRDSDCHGWWHGGGKQQSRRQRYRNYSQH